MTRTIRLAVIGGDGIGPEVVAEALKVLRGALGGDATLETTDFALGAARYLQTGDVLPDAELAGDRRARRDPARGGRGRAR